MPNPDVRAEDENTISPTERRIVGGGLTIAGLGFLAVETLVLIQTKDPSNGELIAAMTGGLMSGVTATVGVREFMAGRNTPNTSNPS
ncbi:MAG: hypothetical protein QG628_673 [Patescibacteria group bacterium]|jgi:hypothetical protein|nr:hypothetical protein [Patescibacteria group bacterium]